MHFISWFQQSIRMGLLKITFYGGFEYVENTSMFTHGLIIKYDKFSDFGHALMVNVGYPEYLQPLHKVIIWKTGN